MSAVLPVDDRFQRLAAALADPGERHALESLLPAYLRTQRWFGGQARGISAASFAGWLDLGLETDSALCIVDATDDQGVTTRHQLYLGISEKDGVPAVADALEKPSVRELLAEVALQGISLEGELLTLAGTAAEAHGASIHGIESHLIEGEQSNSSVMYGTNCILKIYRRLEEGPHPELELLEALRAAEFEAIPALFGSARVSGPESFEAAAMLLQAYVPNEGDGWAWGVENARRALDACNTEAELAEWLAADGATLQGAHDLGLVTAGMHAALAQSTAPDMAPEPLTAADMEALAGAIRREALATRELVHASATAHEQAMVALETIAGVGAPRDGDAGSKVRVHGDYHLGQVLRSAGNFVVTDFEGEPARSLAERRLRQTPLVDVAGMVRSFDYAGQVAARAIEEPPGRGGLARAWTEAMAGAFLETYWGEAQQCAVPFLPGEPVRSQLLRLLELRKALYELRYELNNRPDWAEIPLESIIRLGATRD